MFPLQRRRPYAHMRSDKPIKSGNKKTTDIFCDLEGESDIFYDPEGVLAAPGEGNIPAKFSDLDVHMEDWDSNKEQIAPEPPGAVKEEICRVYLKPRRPSSKRGARALLEMRVDALCPTVPTLPSGGKPGAPNKSVKGVTVGKPPLLKTSTPAVTAKTANSVGDTFCVPAVSSKHLTKAKVAGAGASVELEKKDKILPKIQTPAPSAKLVSEASEEKTERSNDDDEECKENQPPCTFLRGVDPFNDKGFAPESPFGSDLPYLLTPYAEEPILAKDPSAKLRAPISINEAMVLSRGKEIGSVPLIREGALGELSAEHLYLTEPRGLVYIPSAGLQYRYDTSEHFVPTMTMESGLKDMKRTLAECDTFEIWEDEDEGSDDDRKDKAIAGDVHGMGAQGIKKEKACDDEDGDPDGDDDDEDQLDEDEYELLLKLHYGDGWTDSTTENPSLGTILVRSQASANVRISHNNSHKLLEDITGSFAPPAKLRILHRSPGTDRESSDSCTATLAFKTAGEVEEAVRRSNLAGDVNDENAPPPDMDPFAVVCRDENETPPISLHASSNENCLPAVSSMEKTMEILHQKSPPLIRNISPVAFPHSPSVVSPSLSPLTPPNPIILSVTATSMVTITDPPLMPRFPAPLKRSDSFRDFRDPLASAPIQTPQSRRRPAYQNDTDDDDRVGSLQPESPYGTGTHMAKPDSTCGHDSEEMLSQLNLICLQTSNPTIVTTVSKSPVAKSETGTETVSTPISSPTGSNASTESKPSQ